MYELFQLTFTHFITKSWQNNDKSVINIQKEI